jgi:tetratricopeptide (TPR) repeat protein
MLPNLSHRLPYIPSQTRSVCSRCQRLLSHQPYRLPGTNVRGSRFYAWVPKAPSTQRRKRREEDARFRGTESFRRTTLQYLVKDGEEFKNTYLMSSQFYEQIWSQLKGPPVNRVVEFMQRFAQGKERPSPAALRKICEDSGIAIESLDVVARLLIAVDREKSQVVPDWVKTTGKTLTSTGQFLLGAASENGSVEATVNLVTWAFNNDSLHASSVAGPLRKLGEFAQEGDLSAIILQARIDIFNGHYQKAIPVLESAAAKAQERADIKVKVQSRVDSEPGAIPPLLDDLTLQAAAAWRELGYARLRNGEIEASKEAFKRAADEWGDVMATVFMISFYDKYTREWLDYTMRAASAGHGESAYNLGIMYRLPATSISKIADREVQSEIYRPNDLMRRPWPFSLIPRLLNSAQGFWVEPRFCLANHWFGIARRAGFLLSALESWKLIWQNGHKEQALVNLLNVQRNWDLNNFGDTPEHKAAFKEELEKRWDEWTATEEGAKIKEKLTGKPSEQRPKTVRRLQVRNLE